jgi:hypothetical protein
VLTFTTAPTETDLISLATVKAELGITDGAQDTTLSRYIAESSALIAKVCARGQGGSFGKATVVETFRLRASQRRPLWLSHWPVTSITSIVADDETLTATDYELEDGRKLWRLDGDDVRTYWSPVKTVITYVGGYSLPNGCPNDLAAQCLELVKLKYSAKGRDPLLKVDDVPGVGRQEFWVGSLSDDGIPPDVSAALSNYTNFSFG